MTTKAASQDKPPRKLSTTSETATAEAREQADAYESLFASIPLKLEGGDEIMIPPHPDYAMLDDDKMDEWDELMFRVDNEYLRLPDVFVPEQHLRHDNGEPSGVVIPADTIRGELRRPFQIMGENGKPQLVKPPHSVKIVQIALGEAEYKRLRDGGRNASDVWKIWQEQSLRIKERSLSDSKSAGSTVDLAAVPEADS